MGAFWTGYASLRRDGRGGEGTEWEKMACDETGLNGMGWDRIG